MRADVEFAKATAEKGLPGFVSFLAEDAVWLPTEGPPVNGREAIGAAWAPLLESSERSIRWRPDQARVSGSGDLGYTFGRFEILSGRVGDSVLTRGKYATIWKRQTDGDWKVILDIGNSEPAGS